MVIHVARKHIENGFQGSMDSCPIALAMRDAGLYDAYVTEDELVMCTPCEDDGQEPFLWSYWNTDPELQDWIHEYDCGECVDEIDIHLDADVDENSLAGTACIINRT